MAQSAQMEDCDISKQNNPDIERSKLDEARQLLNSVAETMFAQNKELSGARVCELNRAINGYVEKFPDLREEMVLRKETENPQR